MNIGPTSEVWLRAIGVHCQDDLDAIGAIEAYRRIRRHGFNASLNLLYALEGAVRREHWAKLPESAKTRLRAAAKAAARESTSE